MRGKQRGRSSPIYVQYAVGLLDTCFMLLSFPILSQVPARSVLRLASTRSQCTFICYPFFRIIIRTFKVHNNACCTAETADVTADAAQARTRKPDRLPFADSASVKLVPIRDSQLEEAISKVQGLSPYLDEVEYLIEAKNWGYLQGFLGVFSEQEEEFVDLIDGLYPSDNPADQVRTHRDEARTALR
jgi:hypothetical protein